MSNPDVDYHGLAKKFIKIESDLGEDPSASLDQLLNIAKRDATWKSATKSTSADAIQQHYEKLVEEVRKQLDTKEGDK